MSRLVCEAWRCGRRPILAIRASLALDSGIEISTATYERHEHEHISCLRLCVEHAAECGVEQLEQPRTLVQAALA